MTTTIRDDIRWLDDNGWKIAGNYVAFDEYVKSYGSVYLRMRVYLCSRCCEAAVCVKGVGGEGVMVLNRKLDVTVPPSEDSIMPRDLLDVLRCSLKEYIGMLQAAEKALAKDLEGTGG